MTVKDKMMDLVNDFDKMYRELTEYRNTELTPDQMRKIDRLYQEKCEELEKLRNDNERLKKAHEKLSNTWDYWQNEAPAISGRMASLEDDNKKLRDENTSLKTNNSYQIAHNESLKADIEKQNDRIEKLNADIEELRKTNEALICMRDLWKGLAYKYKERADALHHGEEKKDDGHERVPEEGNADKRGGHDKSGEAVSRGIWIIL